jgi:putative addiction module killer protein
MPTLQRRSRRRFTGLRKATFRVKGVGEGVFERRIDFGPGYRIYFGKDGESVVILLGGSGKQRQREAIAAARERWSDYKRRNEKR